MSSELQNIPPFWSALSHWLAYCLYLRLLPWRYEAKQTIPTVTALFWVLWAFMQATGGLDGMAFNLSYIMVALLTLLPFLWLAKVPWTKSLYFCARAFLLGGFAASFGWQMYSYASARVAWVDSIGGQVLFMGVSYALIHTVMSLLEAQHRRQAGDMAISALSALSVTLIAFVVYVLSSLSFSSIETPFGGSTYAEAFNIRTVVYLGGVAILYAYHVQLSESYLSLERDTLQNMLNMQYANYILNQESVDMVNRKYHDLKHQIAILRSEVGQERKLEYLDRMEREISSYETQNKTGNQFLDTILTSKSVHCQKEGIHLTCVADGAALDFMDVMDLSVLFGNALDNAIEAVSQLPDPEERLIHLSVSREKGFLRIRLENRCKDEPITLLHGLPITTKRDKRYHGFGVKSIRATAEKYGGSATVHAENGWFELRVLIPLRESAAAAGQPEHRSRAAQ